MSIQVKKVSKETDPAAVHGYKLYDTDNPANVCYFTSRRGAVGTANFSICNLPAWSGRVCIKFDTIERYFKDNASAAEVALEDLYGTRAPRVGVPAAKNPYAELHAAVETIATIAAHATKEELGKKYELAQIKSILDTIVGRMEKETTTANASAALDSALDTMSEEELLALVAARAAARKAAAAAAEDTAAAASKQADKK